MFPFENQRNLNPGRIPKGSWVWIEMTGPFGMVKLMFNTPKVPNFVATAGDTDGDALKMDLSPVPSRLANQTV